jgi:hypothetical protein
MVLESVLLLIRLLAAWSRAVERFLTGPGRRGDAGRLVERRVDGAGRKRDVSSRSRRRDVACCLSGGEKRGGRIGGRGGLMLIDRRRGDGGGDVAGNRRAGRGIGVSRLAIRSSSRRRRGERCSTSQRSLRLLPTVGVVERGRGAGCERGRGEDVGELKRSRGGDGMTSFEGGRVTVGVVGGRLGGARAGRRDGVGVELHRVNVFGKALRIRRRRG